MSIFATSVLKTTKWSFGRIRCGMLVTCDTIMTCFWVFLVTFLWSFSVKYENLHLIIRWSKSGILWRGPDPDWTPTRRWRLRRTWRCPVRIPSPRRLSYDKRWRGWPRWKKSSGLDFHVSRKCHFEHIKTHSAVSSPIGVHSHLPLFTNFTIDLYYSPLVCALWICTDVEIVAKL